MELWVTLLTSILSNKLPPSTEVILDNTFIEQFSVASAALVPVTCNSI